MPLSESILIYMLLLTMAIVAAGLFRRVSIPYTVLLVVVGILISELADVWTALAPVKTFQLTPDMVFFVFLPALIFEAGLSLNTQQLLKDLAPVMSMAVPALLISTFLVGVVIWWLLPVDLLVALLFGALISATDPVAVVALFKELGAPLRLNVLIEGESLLNDATAIVVFGIVLAMIQQGMTSVDTNTILLSVFEFIRVFIGGAAVGILIGILVSELLHYFRSHKSEILVMSLVTAYFSFIVAEHTLHLSGVMATMTAAMTLSAYGLPRVSLETRPLLMETWEFIALVANSMLFLLVGLSIHVGDLLSHLDEILIAVVVVLLARAAVVYSMVPITLKLFHLPGVSMAYRHIMWWGGLKGGLAIAIVLSIPEGMPGRDLLISMTLGVVLFTLLVNAWSIRPLMAWLGLDKLSVDERVEVEQGLAHAQDAAKHQLEHFYHLHLLSQPLYRQLDRIIIHDFSTDTSFRHEGQHWRQAYLAAFRTETKTIDDLYRSGLISQYTLFEFHHAVRVIRNRKIATKAGQPQSLPNLFESRMNVFHRLEKMILKLLREKNWATPILTRIQYRRLRLHVEQHVADVVVCNAVMDELHQTQDYCDDVCHTLGKQYKERMLYSLDQLNLFQRDFSDLFEQVEKQLFMHCAYIIARVNSEHALDIGEIGIKAFNRINDVIDQGSRQLAYDQYHEENISRLLALVPLFSGLPEQYLSVIAGHAYQLTFLPGDVIIGEGEKGDALYIIRKGIAEVSHTSDVDQQAIVGELGEEDFFGEMALLGNHKRTATVVARSPMTVLRVSRSDIKRISKKFSVINERLNQARIERLANS